MPSKIINTPSAIMIEVRVAAFGKHPAWDDHIDDIGLESERLVWVKRHLYSDGIGSIVASGLWDELNDGERQLGFDHEFVWRIGGSLVVGRLWSSEDGKGRDRFPMIVCAEVRGLPAAVAVDRALSAVRTLRDACAVAETQDTVRGAVEGAAELLRASLADEPAATREPIPEPAAVTLLSEHRAMTRGGQAVEDGAEGEDGFVRVLYALEREFERFHKGADEKSGVHDVTQRAHQLRVPSLSGAGGLDGERADLWLRLLMFRLEESVPMLLIARVGSGDGDGDGVGVGYLDLIAGEPGPDQLACLQTSTKRLPLVTAIPYSYGSSFVADVDDWVMGGRTGRFMDRDPGAIAGGGAGDAIREGAGWVKSSLGRLGSGRAGRSRQYGGVRDSASGLAGDPVRSSGGGRVMRTGVDGARERAGGPVWPWLVAGLSLVALVLGLAAFVSGAGS